MSRSAASAMAMLATTQQAAATNVSACPTELHSVSGISSGGSMAMIHAISRSSCVPSVGVVAGSAYGCNALLDACPQACGSGQCQCQTEHQGLVDAYLQQRAKNGLIDDLSNVKGMKAWLFSGSKDTIVSTCVMQHVERQLTNLGADVATVYDVPAQHGWMIDSRDFKGDPGAVAKCGNINAYFIQDCHFDMSLKIFENAYGSMKPLTQYEGIQNNLISVNQAAYVPKGKTPHGIGMAEVALAYIPSACTGEQASECPMHVRYTGCAGGGMTLSNVAFFFYDEMPFLAESNDIIVLFPQPVAALSDWKNLEGCWDWGNFYGDSDFDTHSGAQMTTVLGMLSGLRELVGNEHTVWHRPLAGLGLQDVEALAANRTTKAATSAIVV